jgi:hypothetical protein
MNPPPRLRPLGIRFASGVVLFAALAMPRSAAAVDVERSILARTPAAEGDPAPRSALGPSRAQGDFAPLLAELAAAVPDSAAATNATPATTEGSVAPAAAPGVTAREETQPSIVLPVLGGIVGGTVGLYGGAIAALALNDDGSSDLGDLGAAVLGGLVAEVVLLPLGVHVGNAGKGSFLGDLAVSALTGVAGIGLIALIQDAPGVIAGVGLQLGSVVYVERREAERRIEARRSAAEPAGP